MTSRITKYYKATYYKQNQSIYNRQLADPKSFEKAKYKTLLTH